MAPLKRQNQNQHDAFAANFHNEKVMAPLKQEILLKNLKSHFDFHNEKVMAPLKHSLIRHYSFDSDDISITKKLWPH